MHEEEGEIKVEQVGGCAISERISNLSICYLAIKAQELSIDYLIAQGLYLRDFKCTCMI
jgi:hypothetical protein